MRMEKIRAFRAVCAAMFGLATGAVWAQVTAPACVPGATVSKTLVDFGAGSDPSLRATDLAGNEGEPSVAPNGTFLGYAFSSAPNILRNGVYYIGNSSGAAGIPGIPSDVKDRNFDALVHPAGTAGNMLIVDPPTGVTFATGMTTPVLRLRINEMTPGAGFRLSVSTRPLGADAQLSMHMVTPTSTGAASSTYTSAHLPMGVWTEASLVPGSMLRSESDWVEVALRTPVAATAHGGAIALDDLRIEIECPRYIPPQVTFDAIAS